jgi:circadian clock protein KaiB
LRIRLYVAGEAPNSTAATIRLEDVLRRQDDLEVDLEIVDVLDHPERGHRDGVLVTPTLVRAYPPPERGRIGNLHDRDALPQALGLPEAPR